MTLDTELRRLERRLEADPADRDARRALAARLLGLGRTREAISHARDLGHDDELFADEAQAPPLALEAFAATFGRPTLALECRLAPDWKGEGAAPTARVVFENELRPRVGKGEVAAVRGARKKRTRVPDELAALLEVANGGTILRPRGEMLDPREGIHLYDLDTIARGGEIPAFFDEPNGRTLVPLGEVNLGTSAANRICGTARVELRRRERLALDLEGRVLHGDDPIAPSLSRFLLELSLDPARLLRRLGVRFIGGHRKASFDDLPYEPVALERDESPRASAETPPATRRYAPAEAFAEGELLTHVKFGEGRVVAVRSGEIDVHFFELGAVRRLAHRR